MKNNKEVKKAREVLYGKSKDEELERLAFLKERTIMEENTMRENALQEGERKSKLEIAKKMKNRKISIRDIVELTGLTLEEVEEL